MFKSKDLGKKHICAKCNTAFYDFGKSDPACPKCGTPASERLNTLLKKAAEKTLKKKDLEDELLEDLKENLSKDEDDEDDEELDSVSLYVNK